MTETLYTAIPDYETATKAFHSFGVKDAKGRAIGSLIIIYECEVVETENGYRWKAGQALRDGTPVTAGMTVYRLYRQATRNGHSYGATQTSEYYGTREAAEARAKVYLAHAAKRAIKISQK